MERFGFIIHPISAKKDVARKYPIAKYLPESFIEWVMTYKSPVFVSRIEGVKSITGIEAEGVFVGCPLCTRQFMTLSPEFCYKRIIQTVKLSEEKGAKICGLGAFTSVVGDGGITIAKNSNIAITTGNSYTISTAIDGSLNGAKELGKDPKTSQVAIVGAAGSIGRVCALIYSNIAKNITLVGRNPEKLEAVKNELNPDCSITITNNVEEGIKNADIVVTVSSAVDSIIEPSFIKSGAVICDVARPRDVSVKVAKERDDVLVIEGGVVKVPGDVDFHFNFGFPPKTAYACMSETMILALEGKYENFSLGKELSVEKVNEIKALAEKHGFILDGYRSFEKAVSKDDIENIKRNIR